MFRALQVSARPLETKVGESSQSMQKPNRTDTYHIRLDRRMLVSHSAEAAFSPCFSVIAGIGEKRLSPEGWRLFCSVAAETPIARDRTGQVAGSVKEFNNGSTQMVPTEDRF
jgi:hypothetical protein